MGHMQVVATEKNIGPLLDRISFIAYIVAAVIVVVR